MTQTKKGDLIGRGREAEILFWESKKVIKLFNDDCPESRIRMEFDLNKGIQEFLNILPKAYEIIEYGDRKGIIYQFIDGYTLTSHLTKTGQGRFAGRLLATLHAEIHKYKISGIRSQKDYFREMINNGEDLRTDEKRIIFAYLDNLPDDNTICHGDFQPENVLLSGDGNFVIDWSQGSAGVHLADVARTCYVLKHGSRIPSSSFKGRIIDFLLYFPEKIMRRIIYSSYIKTYQKLTGISIIDVKDWELIIFAARLTEQIPQERKKLLKMIRKLLSKLERMLLPGN